MPRSYRDPIHKEITLDDTDPVESLIIKLIDSREVQRLRWIRQLGTGWFTFHGAEASRFQHSLGTMHIARLMLQKIAKDLNLDQETLNEYKKLVLSAALLHDIGHGPFSHSTESINEIRHETWTIKLINSPESEINQILEAHQTGLAKEVVQIINKTYPQKFLSSFVNSQIDCDRFDYLLRDSYYTGTSYGKFDLERVISVISVNRERDCLVVSNEKGMLAVEDYLYARYSMYLQVYQHKKSLASDTLLYKLLKRAKLLIRNRKMSFIEKPLLDWLIEPERMSVANYLLVDDVNLLHHIKHWCHEKDYILKNLAKRFITRDLFKAKALEPNINTETLYEEKAEEVRKAGLEPEYFLDIVDIAAKSYSFYNPDPSDSNKAIFIQTQDGGLKEISTVSHVVKSLVENDFKRSWLIYPENSFESPKAVTV